MKRISLFIAILSTAFLAVFCSRHKVEMNVTIGAPVTGDWVIQHELSDFEGLNPVTTSDANAQYFFSEHLYETLLYQDWETLDFIPWIADSLPTVSANHLTYTFHLKKNVKFSDGQPLTAQDVLFSLKAIMDPFVINGAQLRNYFNRVQDASAPDDYTFVVKMSEPYFLADHQIGSIYIMPKHVLDPTGMTDKFTVSDCMNLSKAKKNRTISDFANWFSSNPVSKDPKYLIGSGPYVVKEWQSNDRIIAERNPDYWNKDAKWGKAYPEKIVMKVVNDFNSAITALKGGDLDIVTGITPQLYVHELDVQKDKQLAKDAFFIPVYYYIGWNEANPIFADTSVRLAMTYFTDTKTMIDKVMFGLARPIFGPTYFMRKECDPTLKPYEYDPEKAKQILKDAGWTDSDGDGILDKTINGKKIDFKFTMMINSGNDIRKQTALILSEELRKAGIEMEVQTLDFTVELQDLREHKFDAYIGAWSMPADAPDEFQIWHSSQIGSGGSNYVCYRNKEVDSIIEADRTEFDENKRIDLMRKFQQILYREQPYTFLWTPKERAAYSSRFQNIHWYAIPPGYDPQTWWVPSGQQRYGVSKN